jgi:Protein of unknown function (DUF2799)
MNLQRRIFAFIFAALLLASLGACSSMSATECQALDWRAVGYEDGVAGYPANRIAYHRKSCGKYGVTPNLNQYQVGRNQGLKEFCKPQVGFQMGSQGYTYEGICPTELAGPFEEAYGTGRELHSLRVRAQNADNELESAQQEINRNEEAIARNTALLVGHSESMEQRAQAVVDLKHLSERNEELSYDMPRLRHERERAQHEYEEFRSTLPY